MTVQTGYANVLKQLSRPPKVGTLLHPATNDLTPQPVYPGELLEIMGSIINGFALPLKEEHKDLCDGGPTGGDVLNGR